MGRYLVVFYGSESKEWLFVGITSNLSDAADIAEHWSGSAIFDVILQGEVKNWWTNDWYVEGYRY